MVRFADEGFTCFSKANQFKTRQEIGTQNNCLFVGFANVFIRESEKRNVWKKVVFFWLRLSDWYWFYLPWNQRSQTKLKSALLKDSDYRTWDDLFDDNMTDIELDCPSMFYLNSIMIKFRIIIIANIQSLYHCFKSHINLK